MDDHIKTARKKMSKTIDVLKKDMASIRAGRANPSLLDNIKIEYYGVLTPLNQIAGITAPEPRLLLISPWDANVLPAIEKAILKSDLGLNPSNDGKVIRLAIPALTEERRKELVKVVKRNGEDAKIAIRQVRREVNDTFKSMEKKSEITEDDQRRGEERVQELTDDFTGKVDEIVEKKEQEIMEV
ncbi:MAG: ribosome recycling factor [Clostridia bacterium]|nr:ribosome recycling factor [Clostridia bacterium]